eukprot:CAMPEP_0203950856 /NCGR_PEP_ID=MMETSP0359-20131031/84885_1 /ASSEMBLY_ACC=CAM_ASM_000338 /TAXON_ID=268821 /ORGANISM="Scrippsiella Hangoei, Strain SHTV-5" /LENGTH=56 /DNA_ID=CAMNT_0050883227 /DNA_START=17 /DNA_END=183 /DNA_ORIENTATION=-
MPVAFRRQDYAAQFGVSPPSLSRTCGGNVTQSASSPQKTAVRCCSLLSENAAPAEV